MITFKRGEKLSVFFEKCHGMASKQWFVLRESDFIPFQEYFSKKAYGQDIALRDNGTFNI